MKKIISILVFFSVASLHAYTLKFYNQTGYLLQAIITFDPEAKCKKMTIAIPPESLDQSHQLPLEINLTCCTASIKIQRMDGDVLNRIEYDYQQTRTDEGTCSNAEIFITRRSDNILEIR